MASNVSKKGCCDSVLNLPEEMGEALKAVGGLTSLKGRIPDREDLSSEGRLHQAMSDPIRLQIIHSLAVIDLCPCILKEITGLSDSKLSYHLNILEGEGLIKSSPRQRWRIYILTDLGRAQIKGH